MTPTNARIVLDALVNSIGDVTTTYTEAAALYKGMPTRASKLEGLCDLVRKHQDATAIMQAEVAALPVEPDAWQPIETAPKDSSEFDAWDGTERIANVFWAKPEFSAKEHRAWCVCQYERNYGHVYDEVRGLTHWMPLPKEPTK